MMPHPISLTVLKTEIIGSDQRLFVAVHFDL
jgi:hypothetical protein